MQNPSKIGISVEKQSTSIDRKVSVAPMMDWVNSQLLDLADQVLTGCE
jgi:hypothetical protein